MINEDSNTSVLRAALTEVVEAVPGGSVTAEPGNGAKRHHHSRSMSQTTLRRPVPRQAEKQRPELRRHQHRPRRSPRQTHATAPVRTSESSSVHSLDPEGDALQLLHDQLGARPVEGWARRLRRGLGSNRFAGVTVIHRGTLATDDAEARPPLR